MWGGGADRVEATAELGRRPWERPGSGPEAARIERVSTGETVAGPVAVGAWGDPGEAALEFFLEKIDVVEAMAYPGEARRVCGGRGKLAGGARVQKGVRGAMVNFVIDFAVKDW